MIEVCNVSKTYGATVAAHDVSFVTPPGTITGFVGPNGAGKSTVLKIIAGLVRPDSGHVLIEGADFTTATRPSATMGVFLSAEWLPTAATPLGILEYSCDTQGLTRSRAGQVLERVGLGGVGRAQVRSFSLGMRQRLGIAVSLLARPRILVMDEPSNGLDPDGIHWFRTFLLEAAREGTTVLLSSHHMSELALVADRIVMLREGQVHASGPIADFVSSIQSPPVYVESGDLPALARALEDAGLEVEPQGHGLLVRGASALQVGRIAFQHPAGPGLTHLSEAGRSLEETFFDLLSQPVVGGRS